MLQWLKSTKIVWSAPDWSPNSCSCAEPPVNLGLTHVCREALCVLINKIIQWRKVFCFSHLSQSVGMLGAPHRPHEQSAERKTEQKVTIPIREWRTNSTGKKRSRKSLFWTAECILGAYFRCSFKFPIANLLTVLLFIPFLIALPERQISGARELLSAAVLSLVSTL